MNIVIYSSKQFTEDQMAAHPVAVAKPPAAPQGDPKKFIERQKHLLEYDQNLPAGLFTRLFDSSYPRLPITTVHELRIACGDEAARKEYLADCAPTKTILGRTFWIHRMTRPLTHNTEIEKRKQAIASIAAIGQKIERALIEMRDSERVVMSFFEGKTQLPNCIGKLELRHQYVPKKVRDYCNHSPVFREIYAEAETLVSAAKIATQAFAGICTMSYGVVRSLSDEALPELDGFAQRYAGSSNVLAPLFLSLPSSSNLRSGVLFTLGSFALANASNSWAWLQADWEVAKLYQVKMKKVAAFFGGMKQLHDAVLQGKIEFQLEHFEGLKELFSDSNAAPLISALERLNSSHFFCQRLWNPMLIALSCLQDKEILKKIDQALVATAEIDNLMACANLIKEKRCCFATFQEKERQISAVELVHPSLRSPTANTFKANKILVKGENGSGKSMLVQALAIASIMALTQGIVFAKEFKTPVFENVFTSLQTKEKINHHSHFEAQNARAQAFLKECRENPGKKYLVAMDEAFNGAEAKKAKRYTNNFLSDIGKLENVVCVFSTHDEVLDANTHSWKKGKMNDKRFVFLRF